ncbi:MAG: hypothetical protein WA957_14540 [Alteraurantiacibacter sp.]
MRRTPILVAAAMLAAPVQAFAGNGTQIYLLEDQIFFSRGECMAAVNAERKRIYADREFPLMTRASVHWTIAKTYRCVEYTDGIWVAEQTPYDKPN